ncbi:MAG TPA: nucleoside kinase [Clostridia bacterium]|nr:nucleoside kinase [Clostridia bacterium]
MKIISKVKNSHIEIAEINTMAQEPADFIAQCEKGYFEQIDEIVGQVLESNGRYRVVLLAGPSSSGKTTTAYKLSEAFAKNGVHAPVVSLDDFFLGIASYPRLPDGTPDMESVEALDLPLVNATLGCLLGQGCATFPIFDFNNSARSHLTNEIQLGERGVLVVEGLHALNPRLVEFLDPNALYRAYVSTRTKYMNGETEVLTPKDTRLIRRMVRDHNFRNRSPLETLLAWEDVLDGEEKHIYPFRDSVDYKIDSSLDYEGCVFHHYILPMIESLKDDRVYSGKVKQIVDLLEAFEDIDYRYIPEDSLLREFIGS